MTDMLNVVERAGENLLLAEDYIAREAPARTAATRPHLRPRAASSGSM